MAAGSVRNIRRAVVLGSGVMGSQIAALLASNGLAVDLLDVAGGASDRNGPAAGGLKYAKERRPPAFLLAGDAARVAIGNFEDDLGRVKGADWVIEAVVEDLAVKRELLARIDEARSPETIVTTNTSGISVRQMAEGRSESFCKSFLGTHFFNPPRYMTLLELIPTPATDPALVAVMSGFAERRLGKGVITCRDTPLFIANRIGLFVRMCTIWQMLEEGLSLEEVDAIASQPLGRPKTGVFRLGDLIGLDTTANVAKYLHSVALDDERRELFQMPPFIQKLLDEGALGNKAGRGYYRKNESGKFDVLDWQTGSYREVRPVSSEILIESAKMPDAARRAAYLANSTDRIGQFVWKTLSQCFIYAANRIGEITDTPRDIDRALRWGYNWEAGLFEIWDAIGVSRAVQRMEADGLQIPGCIETMLRSGRTSFYDREKSPPTCIDLVAKVELPLEDPREVVDIPALKRLGRRLSGNEDASIINIGDGVRCLEFHTKMNTLGPGIVEVLESALDQLERAGGALVIGGPATNFSAGANLQRLLDLAKRKEWKSLDRRLQATCTRLGRCGLAVVAAPTGLALGGGAEIVLRSPRVQANRELNMGLVELRVGLIPGAGGTTEMLRRAMVGISDPVDAWTPLKAVFDLITQSRVSTSAEEARELGYLRPDDRISPSRLSHLADAKRSALELMEMGAPVVTSEPEILVLGADALARLRLGLHLAHEGGFITDYDVVVGGKLAWILCGGDLKTPQLVPEKYLLDLEREAFLSLLGDERTQQRIESLLKTGKPLRN